MKLAMFNSKESYSIWLAQMINGIEENGLATARTEYEKAMKGIGRINFLNVHHISPANANAEWQSHLKWLEDQVKYLEKKVNKYKKELAKVS